MKIFSSPKIRLFLSIYLAIFFTSCAPRQVSIEEARRIQTQVFSVGLDATKEAIITVLQDQLYMIDNIDLSSNIIMASRATERKLATTVTEVYDDEVPLWVKLTGVTIIVALIGVIFFWNSDNDEENNNEGECQNSSHVGCNHNHGNHHHNTNYNYGNFSVVDSNGPKTYFYNLNIMLKERDDGRTEVRIIAQGQTLQDGSVIKAGSIQDVNFYSNIFSQIDSVIFN